MPRSSNNNGRKLNSVRDGAHFPLSKKRASGIWPRGLRAGRAGPQVPISEPDRGWHVCHKTLDGTDGGRVQV